MLGSAALFGLASSSVRAQDAGEARTRAPVTLNTTGLFATTSPTADAPETQAEANSGEPYMYRHRPTTPSFELGVYGGVMFFDDDTNLQDLDVALATGRDDLSTGGDLGLRAAFFPASFLGFEAEGGMIFTGAKDESAMVWLFRGHGILQLPLARLVPFALVGVSMLALTSDDDVLGDDTDPAFHFGGGIKYAISREMSLRFDVRDTVLQENRLDPDVEDGDTVHNLELLMGVSFTWGRTPWAPEPPDLDGDGTYDRDDRCPGQLGHKPDGCPAAPPPPPPDLVPDPAPTPDAAAPASDPSPALAPASPPP